MADADRGVNTKEEVAWYRGKRLAYIYRVNVKKNGSHYHFIWGKVARPHGNNDVVRAKFKSNQPPMAVGTKFIREYTSKVADLVKSKLEAQNEEKVKEKEKKKKDMVAQHAGGLNQLTLDCLYDDAIRRAN